MHINRLHEWNPDIPEAIALQKRLAPGVLLEGGPKNVSYIAGVDISIRRNEKEATGSIVLLEYPELNIVETTTVRAAVTFPYIPGLLSFRELPLLLDAFEKLRIPPDLIIVDGQGIAHPRRFGLASHLGLFLDVPAIGCAKSRLYGDYEEPPVTQGSYTYLTDKTDTIGAVLRTKTGVKPVFISPGHRINVENAVKWIMNCCRGYRLPEPTRLAHLAAGGNLSGKNVPQIEKTKNS